MGEALDPNPSTPNPHMRAAQSKTCLGTHRRPNNPPPTKPPQQPQTPQWNPVDESEFKRPNARRVEGFKAALEAAGVTASVRSTRGLEAAAACGQLRNQFQKTPLEQFQVPA